MEDTSTAVLDRTTTIDSNIALDENKVESAAAVSAEVSINGLETSDVSRPYFDFIKRVGDIVFSSISIVIFFPFALIICLCIMIDDFGNPFFVQKRVGKDGKVFKMFKFRTMYKDADKWKADLSDFNEADGIHFKMTNDPRVTRVGKILRRTSIDELPQLLNVILGRMSIIGPRPFVENEQCQLPDDRLIVKPGLSCYWQLADRDNMPIDDQLELDYKYIRERSVRTDIKIIFLTIKAVIFHENC